jgi:hypothetical protein
MRILFTAMQRPPLNLIHSYRTSVKGFYAYLRTSAKLVVCIELMLRLLLTVIEHPPKNSTHKGRIVLVLNEVPLHEGVLRSGDIAPCIVNLATRWEWSASQPNHFTPPPPGESSPVPTG